MLTIFSTPKAFKGHFEVIQRNALKSWKLLDKDVEVILFGDDEGAAEVSENLRLRHEPYVERNEHGTKRLDYMFARAQSIARHDLLCYINCDIILQPDFIAALERVRSRHESFLMVGRRRDLDVCEPMDFPSAYNSLRQLALDKGTLRGPDAIDYFAFRRGLFTAVPPLVVGRIWWDHWLTWQAHQLHADIVDVSRCVTAIHQNHDYGYHPAGATGVWHDKQAQRNYELAGGRWHLYTIADATHILYSFRERRNWLRFWAPYWRMLRPVCVPVWFGFLSLTRPVRNTLRLRRKFWQTDHSRSG